VQKYENYPSFNGFWPIFSDFLKLLSLVNPFKFKINNLSRLIDIE